MSGQIGMKARAVNTTYTAQGLPVITFEFLNRQGNVLLNNGVLDADVEISVKKYRQKRSKDANAYMWELCGLIADAMNMGSDDVYRRAIADVGAYDDLCFGNMKAASFFTKTWKEKGLGWSIKKVDSYNGDGIMLRAFRGSSSYDTKEMSRLIDWLITECNQLNIPTRPQEEIDGLIEQWQRR